MTKRCEFCGRYFTPDRRVGARQRSCGRELCKKARKSLSQSNWLKRNAGYFKGRYWYVKEWREKRKKLSRKKTKKKMIQDKIYSSKPLYKLVLLIAGGIRSDMIQDEIIFKKMSRGTFIAYGKG